MTFEVTTADAFDHLPTINAESVHACVTDPPYGLAFMGRDWDDFEPKEYQEWCERWAREVKRVLKPGGHLLAFSGNRTHHRLFTGVEDAGFEIRDTITWHYGSGFPKALDVSKAIDKAADAEREAVGVKYEGNGNGSVNGKCGDYDATNQGVEITEPATDAAEKWDGFKTALKPATEYVVVARKPLSEGTVAENVQTHGTGALNIDGTRIEGEVKNFENDSGDSETCYSDGLHGSTQNGTREGRYPSNVVFDETEAERLDRENCETVSEGGRATNPFDGGDSAVFGAGESKAKQSDSPGFGDSGGPSRYFYTSKASRSERTNDGTVPNDHPTVKPTDLMEWLVTLVTARDQIVLDPFTGSGTTGIACRNTDRQFVGIERDPGHADTARARMGLTPDDPSRFRDEEEAGLDDFA